MHYRDRETCFIYWYSGELFQSTIGIRGGGALVCCFSKKKQQWAYVAGIKLRVTRFVASQQNDPTSDLNRIQDPLGVNPLQVNKSQRQRRLYATGCIKMSHATCIFLKHTLVFAVAVSFDFSRAHHRNSISYQEPCDIVPGQRRGQ